jgi:hypothetical protein
VDVEPRRLGSIHRFSNQIDQDRTGADENEAGNDQRRFVQHETCYSRG